MMEKLQDLAFVMPCSIFEKAFTMNEMGIRLKKGINGNGMLLEVVDL